jgi:hypothetical protein
MPEPTLQTTALRYAAGDLPPDEVSAFEALLAEDQDARDALAEAVRLSAAAIGQKPPAPHPSCRSALRARLGLTGRRHYPLAWIGLGAATAAACALVAVSLADRAAPAASAVPAASAPLTEPIGTALAPVPHDPAQVDAEQPAEADPRSVAEIWADLSSPDHVEKAHDDEIRRRQHLRALAPQHVSAAAKACTPDGP